MAEEGAVVAVALFEIRRGVGDGHHALAQLRYELAIEHGRARP